MERSYWFGKRVFITGINGFIGGNLAKSLLGQGAEVIGLVRNEKKDTFIHFENLTDKLTLIYGELIDRDLMNRIISEEMPNAVFHLAAQVEVGVGISNPYLTFETNVRGTYTLLEAIRQHPEHIESVIVASTDKAYGPYSKEEMPYKETYPLKPRYPYDTSKACGDMIAQSYANEIYKLPLVITRFCNIFGPGQLNFSAVVPDATTSALGYSKFIPRGDGSQIRDLLFVEDVVDLYLSMGEQIAANPSKFRGEIFNAGTKTPHSVREVIEEIYKLCGNKKDLDEVLTLMKGKKTTGEIDTQFMDYEKANQFFGWAPKHTFTQGLSKTIEWFKTFNEHRYRDVGRESK